MKMKTTISAVFIMVITVACLSPKLLAQAQGGFLPSIFGSFRSIAPQQDGKMVVATSGLLGPRIQRINSDGTPDPTFSFSNPGNEFVEAVALNPDGKILFGTHSRVARLNANGSTDPIFPDVAFTTSNQAQGTRISKIVVASNNQIYITGRFENVNGIARRQIVRLNADGTVDNTFVNTQADGEIFDIFPQSDGKLVIGGLFNNVGGTARRGIARLNSDGTLDTLFSSSLTVSGISGYNNVFVRSVSRHANGKYIIGGSFGITGGGQTHVNLVHLNADGSHDPAFVVPQEDRQTRPVLAVAVQADGKVLVANAVEPREATESDDVFRILARFNADGSRDNSIHRISTPVSTENSGVAVFVQPDGKIVVGFGSNGRVYRFRGDGRWDVPFARFDFDGDERADLSVFRPTNRTWYIHTGQAFTAFQFGEPTDLPAPADYDGDAKTDFALFRQSNGTWYWMNSSNNTFNFHKWGEPGDLPFPGQIPGNRVAFFDIFRPSNSTWHRTARIDDSSFFHQIRQLGEPGDIPLSGTNPHFSVSGPASSTPSVYRPSNGTFYAGPWVGAVTSHQLGNAGDIPVSGDFDGSLSTDYALYSPSTGQWKTRSYSREVGAYVTNTQIWGEPGDIPVPADYDGDQRDDIAVFRPSTGTWYIIGSAEGWRIQQFGALGDIPIPAAYMPRP